MNGLNSLSTPLIHANDMRESDQQNTSLINNSISKALSTLTTSLLNNKFPKSSKRGTVSFFDVGTTRDFAATNATLMNPFFVTNFK